MKKNDMVLGKTYGYKGDTELYGKLTKLKPIVAVLEVFDSVTGDTETHEISYSRLWET